MIRKARFYWASTLDEHGKYRKPLPLPWERYPKRVYPGAPVYTLPDDLLPPSEIKGHKPEVAPCPFPWCEARAKPSCLTHAQTATPLPTQAHAQATRLREGFRLAGHNTLRLTTLSLLTCIGPILTSVKTIKFRRITALSTDQLF
jgi:hypothetical protein